jgi:hypothetical protein
MLLAGMDPRPAHAAHDPVLADARNANASLEATIARPAPVRRRVSVSEEAAFAVSLRPLLLRVQLEGWDLAAACVQQHMSAVGVGFSAARQNRPGDEAQEAAEANEANEAIISPEGTEEVPRRPAVVVEQRLLHLDAPQLRMEVVANELPRAVD